MGLVLVIIALTTSAYSMSAYEKIDAKNACLFNLTDGHGYSNPSNVRIVEVAYDSFRVTGTTKKNRGNYKFKCNFKHGEIINWRVTPNNSKSDKDSAIAAGAGLLALVAIAAAANDDKDHNNRHENHATGGSAFDDMRYLKKQCKQNIRHHIADEDQAVKKIHLDTTHLRNRTLRGEGGVLFRRGGGSDISYECKFDRQGRIYDGHYRFH